MPSVRGDREQRRHLAAILLVSLAGLLLEVGYTRIVSYKLWYYYTYLVIGLVAARHRIRRRVRRGVQAGAAVAHRSHHRRELAGRRGHDHDRVPRHRARPHQHDRDLGLRHPRVVPEPRGARPHLLHVVRGVHRARRHHLGAPRPGRRRRRAPVLRRPRRRRTRLPVRDPAHHPARTAARHRVRGARLRGRRTALRCRADRCCSAPARSLASGSPSSWSSSTALPDVRVEDAKVDASGALFSGWGPVFRVDVLQFFKDQPNRLLAHDGTFGSGIWQFDGNPASLTRFETDPRAIPFGILGTPPKRELIIGSAGGNEILASLLLRRAAHRSGRAEPGHHLAAHRPLRRLHRPSRRPARRRPPPRRRALLPRAQRREVRPRLVRRTRQLRGDQRRVVGRVRPVGELPLHDAR